MGKKHSEETKQKIRISLLNRVRLDLRGEKNGMWCGDNVSYKGLHNYITARLGRPKLCEHCGTKTAKKFEWANKSRKYKREFSDWIRLCTSCHRYYDNHAKKALLTKALVI